MFNRLNCGRKSQLAGLRTELLNPREGLKNMYLEFLNFILQIVFLKTVLKLGCIIKE